MAVPTASKSASSLLRALLREVRLSVPDYKSAAATKLISEQFREFEVTEKQHCRASEEMSHLADTYRTYLRSQRLWLEVHDEYHAKGERSVKDSARLVGLNLPKEYKD